MKRIFFTLIILLASLSTTLAQDDEQQDSIRISLLTCGAYDEVWTLYGHSALRIEMPLTGEDVVANYGLFDFNQPYFVWRFMFGKCDYMMGIVPFEHFIREFSSRNASVYQQEINLTPEEKKAVVQAVVINSMPENCEYRYNFFYDNCATRPRDIILNNIPDKILYSNEIDTTATFRQLIHENNGQKLWCRFGNDLLLGVKADKGTSRADQQFLPKNLMRDFAEAEFVDANGKHRPVVLRSQWILPDKATYAKEFPLSPAMCGILILLATIAVSIIENRKPETENRKPETGNRKPRTESRKPETVFLLDLGFFVFAGILGLVLFLLIFSEHPTVSLNLQILVLNPLYLFLLWRIIPEMKGKKKPYTLYILALCAIMALIGDLLQDYAEGMIFLTGALLLRLRRYTKKDHFPRKS